MLIAAGGVGAVVTVRFSCSTRIAAPVEAVFDLARSIDAHLQSMAASGERAVAGRTSGLIEVGETVTWQATHFRLPFRLTSRIVEMDRPRWFVDEQVRGPFRRLRHEHAFRADGNATVMDDHVEFDAPLGPVGRVVERLVLARYMRRLIEERNRQHVAALEGAGS